MKREEYLAFVVVGVLLGWSASVAVADKVMTNVPDWNQPNAYAPITAGLNNNDAPKWCSPTAGANLMGYWEDQRACAGLTDGQAFAASPAFPNPPNNSPPQGDEWKQSLWHDGMIEMGWHMNTGGWQAMMPNPSWPVGAGITNFNNIGPGAATYAAAAWNDPGGVLTKTAYPNATATKDTVLGQAMWTNYKAEIDANRPVLVTFKVWVDTAIPGGTQVVDGQTVEMYPPDMLGSEPHTVVGVGYHDPTPAQPWNGDEEMVTQDGWSTTGLYVMVPVVPTAPHPARNTEAATPEAQHDARQAEHKDIAHPITVQCREHIQKKVLDAYEAEKQKPR